MEQTKGYSKFRGIISGLTDGKRTPLEFLSFGTKLKFVLSTSEFNKIYIEMISFDSVKNGNVFFGSETFGEKGIKVPYEERYEEKEGYRLVGVNLKKTSSDKETVTILTDEDAIEFVMQNFQDGDSVFIEAEMSKSLYNNQIFVNHKLRKMFPTSKPVDFTGEDFQEMSEFRDKFIFSEATFSKANKKGKIEGYYIPYTFNPVLVEYAINVEDKDDYAIYEYFEKNVKFGDLVQVEGIVHNRIKGHWEESEDTDKPKTDNEPLVGKRPSSFKPRDNSGRTFVKDFEQRELEITAVVSVDKGKYTKEQLLDTDEAEGISDDVEKMPWE